MIYKKINMSKNLFVIVVSILIILPFRLGIGFLINGGKTSDLPFIVGLLVCLGIYILIKPSVEKLYERLYPNG
jgi:hypothetical protein